MNTRNFEKLIQSATGRALTIDEAREELPLDTMIQINRPYGKYGINTRYAFMWKTPKKEDSFFRSFLTAFFSKYKEPDPDTYDRNCSSYGNTWEKYEELWNNPDTHWNCALWGHHGTHMMSRDKLKAQVETNFANFNSEMARLGFYETNYGVGLFTIYGGQWVSVALEEMKQHLDKHMIPFRNELSEAGWVTRFVIGLDKQQHCKILETF